MTRTSSSGVSHESDEIETVNVNIAPRALSLCLLVTACVGPTSGGLRIYVENLVAQEFRLEVIDVGSDSGDWHAWRVPAGTSGGAAVADTASSWDVQIRSGCGFVASWTVPSGNYSVRIDPDGEARLAETSPSSGLMLPAIAPCPHEGP